MNNTIVDLIKAARVERNISQKQMADHLGKTQATMSDLERGKVQVSASELYKIAAYLGKPIEYFYGEEIGNKEIQELVALIRNQPKGDRAEMLNIIRLVIYMQTALLDARKYPKGQKVPIEKIRDFYNAVLQGAPDLNKFTNGVNKMLETLGKELKMSGVEKPRK